MCHLASPSRRRERPTTLLHGRGADSPFPAAAGALGSPQVDVASLAVEEELGIATAALAALQAKKHMELDSLLADCLRSLQANPAAPSRYHFMSAVYVSKLVPAAFALPQCFEVRSCCRASACLPPLPPLSQQTCDMRPA